MRDKERIIKWIESIPMYSKDYDILNLLLNYTNDRFFVRIMTELAKGNILLSDFETVLGGPSYDINLLTSFERRDKIAADLELILNANDAINVSNPDLNTSIYENFIVNATETDIVEEVEEEELYNFFKQPSSNLLYRIHKDKLLELFNNNTIDKNFLNLYVGVPIIPINYNDVILTETDKQFGLSKGLSMEEVKKIKSLSLYYRVRGD